MLRAEDRVRSVRAAGGAVSFATTRGYAFSYNVSRPGTPVSWQGTTVEVVLDGSVQELDPRASEAIHAAFGAGSGPARGSRRSPCTTETPIPSGTARAASQSQHRALCAEGGSPAEGALGITVLTYGANGAMLDADIVMNGGSDRPFAMLGSDWGLADEPWPYDLQNVATHETGHFLGLGEELLDREATMFVSSAPRRDEEAHARRRRLAGITSLYDPRATVDEGSPSCAMSAGRATPRLGDRHRDRRYVRSGDGAAERASSAKRTRRAIKACNFPRAVDRTRRTGTASAACSALGGRARARRRDRAALRRQRALLAPRSGAIGARASRRPRRSACASSTPTSRGACTRRRPACSSSARRIRSATWALSSASRTSSASTSSPARARTSTPSSPTSASPSASSGIRAARRARRRTTR